MLSSPSPHESEANVGWGGTGWGCLDARRGFCGSTPTPTPLPLRRKRAVGGGGKK